jgi:hypothetical protein
MSKAFRLSSVVAILVLPSMVCAQVDIAGTQHVLTIHGTLTADQKAAQKIGYDAISIGFAGAPPDVLRWLGVVKAEAYDGDAFLGKDYLDMVDGYTPNLLASGKPELVAKLRNAPTGNRLVVMGVFDQTARTFLLGSVKVMPASASP